MSKKLLWFILILILFACSKNTDLDSNIGEGANLDFSLITSFEDLFNVKEITLNSDVVILDRLSPVFTADFDENIYVASAKEIYKFDRTGKYINAFRSIGRGPGEYIRLHALCVGEKGNIYIDNPPGRKILVYDKDFNFLIKASLS